VLIRAGEGPSVQSLSRLFDGAVKAIAADATATANGETACRAVEREILQAAGGRCLRLAVEIVGPGAARVSGKDDKLLQDSLSRLRAALKNSDGDMVDCDKPCRSACSGTPGKRCRTRRRKIPRRHHQAADETIGHPERRFRPLQGRP
jgi:hypothetical protein